MSRLNSMNVMLKNVLVVWVQSMCMVQCPVTINVRSTVWIIILLSQLLLSESICGDKAMREKKCGDFESCSECIECESQCAWCAIGGLCNRFCFHSAVDLHPCTDDDCVKSSEFKCMTITNSNYANTDYEKEGGIILEKSPKKELERGIGDGKQESRKDRAYDAFSWVSKDVTDKKYCPDCKEQKWVGRDDFNRKGSSFLPEIGNLRGG
jgi:hypothetical protein